ncbi:MAG: hypothetical protein ACXAAK_09950 [Candidatus Thorarchaeota archaeon]
MSYTTRTPTCVKDELVALLILVQNPTEVSMREEEVPFEKDVFLLRDLVHSISELLGYSFGAKLLNQTIIVDDTFHFPRRHYEVFVVSHKDELPFIDRKSVNQDFQLSVLVKMV